MEEAINTGSPMGSINVKPNRPDPYNGKRDILTVRTWLYKVEQYLNLSQLRSTNANFTQVNKVLFTSTFLGEMTAIWWCNVVQRVNTPKSWAAFKSALQVAFVPEDHVRRARKRFRKLHQVSSVSKYL